MEKKTILLNNKGMTRDISISKANSDFAYENFNIRVIPMDKDTLLTVTNERGNKIQNLRKKNIKYNKKITVQIVSDAFSYRVVLSEKLPFDIKLSWKREENVESERDGEVLIPKNTTIVTREGVDTFPSGYLYKMSIEEVNNTTGNNFYYNIKYKYNKTFQEFFKGNEYEVSYNIFNFNSNDTLLGYSVINQYLVLFITNEITKTDSIYRVTVGDSTDSYWEITKICSGNLNFNVNNPIEALSNYESEDIIKVYWVDGINQPRFINISDKSLSTPNTNTFINFISDFNNSEKVTITKEFIGESGFKSGIIQYMFTYSNKFGQETNLAYISPIYYISPSDRGASDEEKVNCQFHLEITDSDTRYDKINIYSIIRTSLGGDFAAYKVASINTGNSVSYTDNGNYSEAIDVTSLLYVGGREIIASTLTAKDNTLFLGDLMLKNQESNPDLKALIKTQILADNTNPNLKFEYTDNKHSLTYTLPEGYYDYDFQLNESSDKVTTFKCGQNYRFAIRFVTPSGSKSACYWIGDAKNTLYPKIDEDNNIIKKACITYEIPTSIKDKAKELGYVEAELMVAQVSELDRNIVAQGFVVPTMFNLLQRFNNAPFALPSWFTRMRNSRAINRHFEALPSNDNEFAELQCVNNDDVTPYAQTEELENQIAFKVYSFSLKTSKFGKKTIGKLKRYDITKEQASNGNIDLSKYEIAESYKTKNTTNQRSVVDDIRAKLIEWGFNSSQIDIAGTSTNNEGYRFDNYDNWYSSVLYIKRNFKNQERTLIEKSPALYVSSYSSEASYNYSRDNKNTFFLDESIVSFYSPEINKDNASKFDDVNLKFRVVGIAQVSSNITDYSMETTNNNPNDAVLEFNLNKKNLSNYSEGLSTFPLFNVSSKLWYIYPWHKTGSIINSSDYYTVEEPKNVLKSKTIANLRFSFKTFYGNTSWNPLNGINPVKSYSSDEVSLKQITYDNDKFTYQGNYETVLACTKSIPSDSNEEYIKNHYGEDEGYYINNAGSITEMTSISDIENSMAFDYGNFKEHLNKLCYDPIKIAFKSCPHAIISLKKDTNESQVILPNVHLFNSSGKEIGYSSNIELPEEDVYLPWDNKSTNGGEVSATYTLLPPRVDKNRRNEENLDYLYFDDLLITDNAVNINVNKTFFEFTDNYNNLVLLLKNTSDNSITPYRMNDFTFSNLATPTKLGNPSNIKLNTGQYGLTFTFTSSFWTDKVILKIYDSENNLFRSITSTDKTTCNFNDYQLAQNFRFTLTAYPDDSYSEVYLPSDEVPAGSTTYIYQDGESSDDWLITQPEETTLIDDADFIPVNLTISGISEQRILIINRKSTGQQDSFIYEDGKINPKDYKKFSIYQEDYNITLNKDYNYPYVLIGELYNGNINGDLENQYGGTSDYALQNITFIPTYGKISLDMNYPKIKGYTGDTFFQRWDCERILPLKEDSENSVVDMLSLYLESYTNLDGRYDKRRGFMNNIKSTLENTNLINKVYSASGSNGGNTIFTSKILDDKFNLDKFPSQITWSKTKTPTEEVDTWTNITLASTLDMDGNKGPVRALRRFNNSIISFQDIGIAEILFNSRTQLSTVEGVPIEIANSAKVDGKRYISDKSGCVNKWSIVETKSGIYFIDNITSSISLFNGNIKSLSDELGFKNWIGNNNSTSIWNPKNPTNFIGYWDRINDDVYFINPSIEQNTLCYNEMLGVFTSFYNYGNVPMMVNVENKFISFKNGNLWVQGEGDYNRIYGSLQPFKITYKVNPNPYVDKIFNNIEYRADMFNSNNELTNNTFDKLEVWNEYQSNEVNIQKNELDTYPDVQRKFRVWRLDIPRDKVSNDNPYGLNRMRNPWLFVKLTKNTENTQRMEFHNIDVTYFE